jgi:hypothetical protein
MARKLGQIVGRSSPHLSVSQSPGEGMRDGRQGRTDHPERRAHLAGAPYLCGGIRNWGNIQVHPGWFEEDAQDSRTFLAHSGRSEILEAPKLSK